MERDAKVDILKQIRDMTDRDRNLFLAGVSMGEALAQAEAENKKESA